MYHIGICDDSKETCAELEELLCDYGKSHGIPTDITVCYTGEELCEHLKNKKNLLDVLFLDIELLTTDGIKVGRFIREELDNLETLIIYISAKSSYAMELFRIQPLDFLIKPLDQHKVEDVMERARKLTERRKGLFEYYSGGIYFKVMYKDILYFVSDNKKIRMVMKDGEKEFTGKLKDIGKTVPVNFIQIHQSYLINFDCIDECTYETVKMKNGKMLSISQPYRKEVRNQIKKRVLENRR